MPDTTTTASATGTLSTVATAMQTALAARANDANKELVKKLRIVAKRENELAAYTAKFNKNVADFTAAVDAAVTPEDVYAAIDNFKFPEHKICSK